jgi:transcriptional regulator with XRE-family HTH domain
MAVKKEISIDRDKLEAIGERMIAIRKALGYQQKEMAARLGFSEGYICQIEKGNANPTLEFFYLLTSKFQVSLDYLFYGEGEMFYKEAVPKDRLWENHGSLETIEDVLWYHDYSPTFRLGLLLEARKIFYDQSKYISQDIDYARKQKQENEEKE